MPRRATHVDPGAEAGGDILIDIAQHHYPAVEGDDLAILGAAEPASAVPPLSNRFPPARSPHGFVSRKGCDEQPVTIAGLRERWKDSETGEPVKP
jgi:hypothetical protein